MRPFVKLKRKVVRLSKQDAADLAAAAHIEAKRRGEPVGDSTLLRELAMPRVRELIGKAA